MNIKLGVLFSVVLISAQAVLDNAAAADPQRPNVILIMSDDQGYGDFGIQGNPVFRTPHIDAMAKRSASMSTFYVCPVCSPTCACLMTGRYNYRTRVVDTWVGRSMMEPSEVTLAEVLSDAGYATGIFGKWHLGDCYPMRPIDQGFQMSLVLRGGGFAQPSEPPENQRRYTNPILFRNGLKVQTEGYCTDVYFDAALEFIEASQRQQRSFFVYLPTNTPHSPLHDVPESLRMDYRQQADKLLQLPTQPVRDREQQVDMLSPHRRHDHQYRSKRRAIAGTAGRTSSDRKHSRYLSGRQRSQFESIREGTTWHEDRRLRGRCAVSTMAAMAGSPAGRHELRRIERSH